jgi:hypothetical protein
MQVKTLLAVLAIVIAVGFVAANSIIPQASAIDQFCVGGPGEPPHNGACIGAPGHQPGPAQLSAPGHEKTGNAASQDAPGHLK